MLNNIENKPVIGPVVQLLTSRKFIIVVSYIVAQFIIRAIPSLAPYVGDLTNVITVAAGVMFGHLSLEDIIKLKAAYTPTSLIEAGNTLATGVIGAALPLSGVPSTSSSGISTSEAVG